MPSILTRDAWDVEANILDVLCVAKPPIAPELAKLTGHAVGTVEQELIGMEDRGLVRKTGIAQGRNGEVFDTWARC